MEVHKPPDQDWCKKGTAILRLLLVLVKLIKETLTGLF
jgi:hypothetical protein